MTTKDDGPAPSPLKKVNELAASHGALEPGKGMVSGVIALSLGMLAVLSVLAMRFPAYLTTPEFRHVYDVTALRYVLFGGMVLAGALALTNIVLGRVHWLSAWAFAFLGVAQLLGGPGTPIEDFPDHTPYVGLDFFVLDPSARRSSSSSSRSSSRSRRTSPSSGRSGRSTSSTSS